MLRRQCYFPGEGTPPATMLTFEGLNMMLGYFWVIKIDLLIELDCTYQIGGRHCAYQWQCADSIRLCIDLSRIIAMCMYMLDFTLIYLGS